MSLVLKKFYRLFWSNQTCMNLFSLSKEELLDTHSNSVLNINYSKPRIIISNVQENPNYTLEIIKNRTDSRALDEEDEMSEKLDSLEPILMKIYESDFKKGIEKIFDDYDKKPLRFLWQFFRLGAKPEEAEKGFLEILKKYGLVARHLNSFDEVKQFYRDKYFGKNSELIEEANVQLVEELIIFLKNLQLNAAYKSMYNSNQVLVNSLHEEDNFQSRIHLFRLLYESDIIYNTGEDAFIECTNCEKGKYRGTISLEIPPSKLDKLVCPLCGEKLTYFISYGLHEDLYKLIKTKDGLLHGILVELLESNNLKFKSNLYYLDDIEIDCLAQMNNTYYVIEVKMFKLNTSENKLKQKVRASYDKLLRDISRLNEIDEFIHENLSPLLLVNISNSSLLNKIISEIKSEQKFQEMSVFNIAGFQNLIQKKIPASEKK